MYKLLSLIFAIAVGIWALEGFGSIFGLTPAQVAAIKTFKTDAIDRAAPVYAPLLTKQQILDTEIAAMSALPSASNVQATLESQLLPAVISTANQLGQSFVSAVPAAQIP